MKRSVNATIDTLIRRKSIYSLTGYTEDLEIINSTIDTLNYHGLYCNESIRKMIYKKRRLLKRFKEN